MSTIPRLSRVQELRLNAGLTLQELADAAGVSLTVIYAADRGRRPHPRNAKKIADYFEMKVMDVFPITNE